MELTESIETLNKQLADRFGIDTNSSNPIWRIVWAEDQTEKRKSKFTETGIELLYPEPMVMKKYNWIKQRYILEKLEMVPLQNIDELCGLTVSYEIKFVFQNSKEGYLPPRMDVCAFVIDHLNFAQFGHKSQMRKYVQDVDEEKRKDFDRIYSELFGDETEIADALHYGEGVSLPSKFFGEN